MRESVRILVRPAKSIHCSRKHIIGSFAGKVEINMHRTFALSSSLGDPDAQICAAD